MKKVLIVEIFIERATTAQCMNVSTSVIGVGKGSCRITSTDSSAFVEQCLHYYYSIFYIQVKIVIDYCNGRQFFMQ